MYWVIILLVLAIHFAYTLVDAAPVELTPAQLRKRKELNQKIETYNIAECAKLFKHVKETPMEETAEE
jgi:hypothetical protein